MESLVPRVAALALLALPVSAAPQAFVSASGKIPQGAPNNNSWTENVDFSDIDLDGDFDALFADGGECCNDQNRLWVNLGGQQGGTVGFFQDRTIARLPAVLDNSRDIEFVDYDNDGDSDIFVTNTSQLSNQTSRFWTNVGNAQGGSLGFYVDETASRWIDIAVNDGVSTFSSVPTSLALVAGGFIDWTCDGGFADLDNDGDLDLVQATYGLLGSGKVPTRLFLNDGDGRFEEYNPSGFQLTLTNLSDGAPGLWAEGTQLDETTDSDGTTCDIANTSISVELADLDGDLDIDILTGQFLTRQRIFRNNLTENGTFSPFRDVSEAAWPASYVPEGRKYEQELGDLDGDDDLDIFGTNWVQPCDLVLKNEGGMTFGPPTTVAGSCVLNNEPDFIDFDADGDLDVLVASDEGQELLFVNQGHAGGGQLVLDPSLLPLDSTSSLGVDAVDLDNDGDYDAMVANDFGQANVMLENVLQIPDTHAPRIANLEQAPDRAAGPTPTVVRLHVYDNQPTYLSAFDPAFLVVTIDGSPAVELPMRWSGGQVLRGESPGALAGTIEYRARVTDRQGNATLSAPKSFVAGSTCAATATNYCTSQTTSQGCTPTIGTSGFPSASAGVGHFIEANGLVAGQLGLVLYSTAGPNNVPLLGGTLCVGSPLVRTPILAIQGAGPCTGLLRRDFNAYVATGVDPTLAAGADVWAQVWSRDPGSPTSSNLTSGVTFTLCD
ncbi:MAG TPA: VCBS repeat-containing protein [Planctomycetota bacterium]|nr:VCBS repeat-containing protein [Planctomycetota bacterium]